MSTPTPRTALKATGMRRRYARCLETELATLTAERDQLRARAELAEAEVGRLRAGIAECLHTNGHLADGEDCTLIGLKRCLHNPTAARESKGGAA